MKGLKGFKKFNKTKIAEGVYQTDPEAMADDTVIIDFLESIRGTDVYINKDMAKMLLYELAFHLVYEFEDKKEGLPLETRDAAKWMKDNAMWLLELHKTPNVSYAAVARWASMRKTQKFDEGFDGRRVLARQKFGERVGDLEILIRLLMSRALKGEGHQIDRLLAAMRLEAEIIGYKTDRIAIETAGDDFLSEREIETAQRAREYVTEYDKEQLSDGEGSLVQIGPGSIDEEEIVLGDENE